jgi:hypothetical protein
MTQQFHPREMKNQINTCASLLIAALFTKGKRLRVARPYTGILFGHEKEQSTADMLQAWMHPACLEA